MRKINEIFYSLQGEGYFTGTPAVFIRFSGCNMKCDFCDTQHEDGVMMSDDEILEEVRKYPCRIVVLTGGEPALSVDFNFVNALHLIGKYVTIETNGSRSVPSNIDWVTCSPKDGSPLKLERIDEVKVVFVGQDVSPFLNLKAKHHFLQPCSCLNTAEVVEYILSHPEWRLSLQTHKLLGIR